MACRRNDHWLSPFAFPAEKIASFGSCAPMKRAREPMKVTPCRAFLAPTDSSCMTGQVLHPNSGQIING
jgi:hypothetical protein